MSHEVVWEFFATNAPDPTHWTLNSCIAVFHCVWVHFGLFRYSTKHDAKRVEPLQFLEIGFHVEIHAIEWHDF